VAKRGVWGITSSPQTGKKEHTQGEYVNIGTRRRGVNESSFPEKRIGGLNRLSAETVRDDLVDSLQTERGGRGEGYGRKRIKYRKEVRQCRAHPPTTREKIYGVGKKLS